MNKKKVIISLMAVAITSTLGYATLQKAYAQENTKYSPLIQRLIEKFNLNESEVYKIADEYRDERHTEMQKTLENRLDQEVANGNLTSEQKNLILAKVEDMHENKPDFYNMPFEEKHTKMNELRTELDQWAKDNGIDTKYLRMFGRTGNMLGKFNR